MQTCTVAFAVRRITRRNIPIPPIMSNAHIPYVRYVNGLLTYGSIDDDDGALYDSLPNDRTRNAFLAWTVKMIRQNGRDCKYSISNLSDMCDSFHSS
jgi:hypothetical protein